MSRKYLLLDIDNTLYRYEPRHKAALEGAHAVARELSKTWETFDAFAKAYLESRAYFGKLLDTQAASHSRLLYFKRAIELADEGIDPSEAIRMEDGYWGSYLKDLQIDPDCRKVLTRLHEEGAAIAFVSNLTTAIQIRKLKILGVDHLGPLVSSEEAGVEKPSPVPFKLALQKIGATVKQAIMIGDEFGSDIQGAKSVGMPAIWITLDKQNPPQAKDGVEPVLGWARVDAKLRGF